MSKVVALRGRIMDTIRDTVTELAEVEWYDGMFDEDDIRDWSIKTPISIVSVMDAPTTPHSTGELNADLKILVVTICHDQYSPRDADEMCWTIMEKIADLAKHNTFGDPNVGPPCNIRFKKLALPSLRREGISLGITEWKTTLTFGTNTALERILIRHPETNEPIMQVPPKLFAAGTIAYGDVRSGRSEVTPLYDEDEV